MDHSHHMGHGDHAGHDMPMTPGGHQCNMNMIFTWDTTDLCIIFRWWHVSGPWSLLVSLLGVVALTAGYELVREMSRQYDLKTAEGSTRLPPDQVSDDGPRSWFSRLGQSQAAQESRDRMIKALFYAAQVFYSFLIMLLFMTYNGFVMLAVAVGAFAGYILFSNGPAAKTVACH